METELDSSYEVSIRIWELYVLLTVWLFGTCPDMRHTATTAAPRTDDLQ
jgi:hypothetical protein